MSAPNFFRNPRAHNEVEIGGRLLKARLRAEDIDGLKIEAEWKEQKSTGTSGATQTYQGMKPAGPHKLTFVTVNADVEDDLLAVRDMMLPKPGLGGAVSAKDATTKDAGTGSSTTAAASPTTAEGLLQQAQASLAALNNPTASAAATGGAGSSSAKAAAGTGANPGPKPPTLSIRNAGVNDLGTTAISLKSYEAKYGKTGERIHIFELIPQKPVTPAGTGVAPVKSPDKPGSAFAGAGASADATVSAAAASSAAGAGT